MRNSPIEILVFSDSHGSVSRLCRALERHPGVKTVCHLGDGARDADAAAGRFPDRTFFCVAGNCDAAFAAPPTERDERFSGRRVFLTHGHLYGVKTGVGRLLSAARSRGAEIVLFGHTHRPLSAFEEGIYLFNPGSVRAGAYGLISVSDAGVLMQNLNLD